MQGAITSTVPVGFILSPPPLPSLPFPRSRPCAVVNLVTNRCVDMIGKDDSVRFLAVALFQGKPSKSTAASTLVGFEGIEGWAAFNGSLIK